MAPLLGDVRLTDGGWLVDAVTVMLTVPEVVLLPRLSVAFAVSA